MPSLKSGVWGNAEEVPNTSNLNSYGIAHVNSVSCASSGNCSAGGYYYTRSTSGIPYPQAFVVNETSGTWGQAEEVPGVATLGVQSQVLSVSCASAGNCSAGGWYGSDAGEESFVVNEAKGTWGNAEEVPGTAALNVGEGSWLNSVSCPSPGNCSGGGYYGDNSGNPEAYVVDETNGTWGEAEEVPGMGILNVGEWAETESVSCATAANCVAGGYFTDSAGSTQGFLVEETDGVWGDPVEVFGPTGSATVDSVSCDPTGDCSAGGFYDSAATPYGANPGGESFVVDETDGTWGDAEEVPGTATLNVGGNSRVSSLSCTSPGDCSAGGSYLDGSGHSQTFVVDEANGTWGNAEELPGMATLNAGGFSGLSSISCASPGNCSAGGFYRNETQDETAFVVNEANGTWADAEEVPGMATLDGGSSAVLSVSCAAAGNCSAGGWYIDSSGSYQAFVVGSTNTAPSVTSFTPTSGPVGTKVKIKGTNLSGATKVTFDGKAATINSDSATTVVVHVPTGANTGQIAVKTSKGTATSVTDFTIT